MKPAPFKYVRPGTLLEALQFLAQHGEDAKPLAGGQSLVPMLNLRLARLDYLVDITRVEELEGVSQAADGSLLLGGLVRHRELATFPLIREHAPLLALCAPLIGHPAIRNRGTLGGSVAHADPAAELPSALVALDATLLVASAHNNRVVTASSFFQGIFTTVLATEELVVGVRVPARPLRTGWAFTELARRHGDFALVGAAARISLDPDGRCSDARLVLSGVAGVPHRAVESEDLLRGRAFSDALLEEAARPVTEGCEVPSDVHASSDYRRQVARVYARRALQQAWERAQQAS